MPGAALLMVSVLPTAMLTVSVAALRDWKLRLAMVWLALRSRLATVPLVVPMVTSVAVGRALLTPMVRVPELMRVSPVKMLAAPRVSVAVPALLSVVSAVMGVLMIVFALAVTVMGPLAWLSAPPVKV